MLGEATCALLADGIAGEPPAFCHPTVAMGHFIARRRRQRRATTRTGALLEGAYAVGSGVAIAATVAGLIDQGIGARNPVVRGLALKPAMSLRALVHAARRVQRALREQDLDTARRELGTHLVSRDTGSLSASEIAGAAIESVAENLSDSIVAPLLAFRTGGLTAAYAYRMVNTADAMLGYHTPELEWFGKVAARVDDALNIVPARLTAAMICLCAAAGNGSASRAGRVMLRDAHRTASPNAGWPMAAMAGALGVRLTKRDHYTLNGAGREPRASDIGSSVRIAVTASVVAALAIDAS